MDGELSEQLTGNEYQLVTTVWNANGKTVDRLDLAEAVYDDHGHKVTLAAARSYGTKINKKAAKLGWKLRVPKQPPCIIFEKIPTR